MRHSLRFWTIWFAFLLVLDVLFPFYLLIDVAHARGSFFFWTVWTLLAIGSMFAVFIRWRDNPTAGAGERDERMPS